MKHAPPALVGHLDLGVEVGCGFEGRLQRFHIGFREVRQRGFCQPAVGVDELGVGNPVIAGSGGADKPPQLIDVDELGKRRIVLVAQLDVERKRCLVNGVHIAVEGGGGVNRVKAVRTCYLLHLERSIEKALAAFCLGNHHVFGNGARLIGIRENGLLGPAGEVHAATVKIDDLHEAA